MTTTDPLLECVPNFSEGRDQAVIDAIAAAIRSVPGTELLHMDSSPSANRTVMTFAGRPESVTESAFRAITTAAERIDMRRQEGVHPRIGATDVCPLIPLRNMEMQTAADLAMQLSGRVCSELRIPVYLYEYAARADYRRALPDIRKGQYEGLEARMQTEEWKPDFVPGQYAAGTGATVIGARDILVAFNIGLDTRDAKQAAHIAAQIRERGYLIRENGIRRRIPGKLPALRAIGWFMEEYDCAQISMNLLDYRITSPLKVWETCREIAAEAGVGLTGSEVIGLIPEACLLEAGQFAAQQRPVPEATPEALTDLAVQHLGLNYFKPFEPGSKILEHTLRNARLI